MEERWRRLDEYVEAFELDRAAGESADLADFLPPPDHPDRPAAIIELIRVDLEFGWDQGTPQSIERYRQMFPDVLGSTDQLGKVAYEEYRLRRRAGESVSREEYQRRYAIDTQQWPDLPIGNADETSMLTFDEAGFRADSRYEMKLRNELAAAAREMPAVGDRFAGFDLVGELGQGAFGRVFLARQDDLARRFVALKITSYLSVEPQRLARLQHTNIVPIYSVHRCGSLQALCMPFLGPNTLADVLQTFQLTGALPVSGQAIVSTLTGRSTVTTTRDAAEYTEWSPAAADPAAAAAQRGEAMRRLETMDYLTAAIWIVSRVADGLAYAHEHGIVHRDLKPANILLTDDGEPLLLDFNLATQSDAPHDACRALIGGTLPYIGPEHLEALQQGGTVGAPSDVYSLGVILFQLLSGRLPYPAPPGEFRSVVPQMLQQRRRPAPSLRSLNPLVSPGLESIVNRCLAPDCQQRYATARELQQDLQRHLQHRPLQHAPDRSWLERVGKWGRRHPRTTSATTVAVVALLVLAALGSWAIARSARLAASEARESLRQTEVALQTARYDLNSPFADNLELERAVQQARSALGALQLSAASPSRHKKLSALSGAQQHVLQSYVDELIYLVASGTAQLAVRADDSQQREQLMDEALRWNALLVTPEDPADLTRSASLQRARFLSAAGQENLAQLLREQAAEEAAEGRYADGRSLAAEYVRQGRFAEAIALLRQLAQEQPDSDAIWFSLGNAYVGCNRLADAEECYDMTIALRPHSALAWVCRGVVRLQTRQFQAARQDFDQALRLQPHLFSALVNRALARQGLQDLTGAAQDLDAAMALGTPPTRLFLLRSRIRAKLGDTQAAQRDFRQAMERTPRDELSWVARGVARLSNDPQQALSDFQQALQLNPHSRLALQNIAHVKSEQLGDVAGALEVLDQLIRQEPANATALAGRGVLLARQGRRDASRRDAEAALRQDPAPLIVYQAACIYALLAVDHPEDAQLAVRILAAALQQDPALVDVAQRDPDLDPLRDHGSFQEVLAAARVLRRESGRKSGVKVE